MQRLDHMLNTNRLAIKTAEMGKFVIERVTLNDKVFFKVIIPKTYRIDAFNINLDNSLLLLNRLDIYNDFAEINVTLYENMGIKTYHIIDQRGYLHDIYNMYILEPEEKTGILPINISLKGIRTFITDPDMFTEMYDNNLVKAEDDVLIKYDLYEPKFNVIEGEGKSTNEDFNPNLKLIKK